MNRTIHNLLSPMCAVITIATLSGCAGVDLPSVHQARSDYTQASENENIQQNASVALYEAEQQLQKLNRAVDEGADTDELDHLAYLVQQRVDIAEAMATQKMAETQISEVSNERNKIQMQIRQAEVQRAEQKTTSLEQQLEDMQAASVRQDARGTVITLSDVFFDFNKATLKSGATQNLDTLVNFLRDNPQRNLIVEGFTDSIGTASYNQQLSQQRAQAVIDYMVSEGISRNRLAARGYGEAFPVASNENPTGRQLNRRVEIVVLNEGQQPATASRQRQRSVEMATFSELDRNKDGYVSRNEAQQFQALRNNFEQYDQNSDEQLDQSEFSAFEEMEIQQQQQQRRQIPQ